MSRLSLQLLGPFVATYDREPLTRFRTKSVQALLIYLTCQPEAHRRESLIELLWPGVLPKSGRDNLRQTLARLRRALPDFPTRDGHGSIPLLLSDRHTVQIDPDVAYDLDMAAFEAHIVASTTEDLEAAVALYRGDFLRDFYLPDSAPFEQWAGARRADLRRAVLKALDALASAALKKDDLDRVENYARKQLTIDELHESAHRYLMELLARQGARSQALAQYETCRQLLQEELSIEPSAETEALVEAIRTGALGGKTAQDPVAATSQPASLPPFLRDVEKASHAARPVFVARERQLEKMRAQLDEALAGDGSLLFVTGGAGRGKSALMTEFGRRAMVSHPDLLVASGSCNAYSGIGDPHLPFREVMGMLTGDVEAQWVAGTISQNHAQRLWANLPKSLEALADHGPYLVNSFVPGRALLSRAVAVAPEGALWLAQLRRSAERKESGTADLEQSHLFQQFTNLMRALSEQRPLLLLMDDMQWADAASISLLFHLGRRLGGAPILVACAYHPEEVALGREGERHPLEKVLSEFKRQFGDVWVDLAAVQESEGRRFVDAFLETQPNRLGESFRTALTAHTKGHALFTIELLRAMQERGDLVQNEAGQWVEGSELDWERLPSRVEAVIEERVNRLEEELWETLSIASVEGEDFTAQVVARVQELGERKLLHTLSRELAQRHRLVRGRGERQLNRRRLSHYRFAQSLFQQYLYNSLDPGERRLLHQEVAAVLETLYEGEAEQIAVQLAHHYSQAGDEDKARKQHTIAADAARKAYANEATKSHYRRALSMSPSISERAYLLTGLGRVMFGRFGERIPVYHQALELYRALGPEAIDDVAKLYALLSDATWDEDLSVSLELCREGLEAVAGAKEGPGLAQLLCETASAYMLSGLPAEAWSLAKKGLKMAESQGNLRAQAIAMNVLGSLPWMALRERLEMLRNAAEFAEASGLHGSAASALNNLAVIHPVIRTKIHHLRRAAELARQTGSLLQECFLLGNLGGDLLLLGDLKGAEETLSTVRRLLSQIDDPPWRFQHAGNALQANIMAYRGEWPEAVAHQNIHRDEARHRGQVQNVMLSDVTISSSLFEMGELAGALGADLWEEAEAALSEATEIGSRIFDNRTQRRLNARAAGLMLQQGRLEEAHTALGVARASAGSQIASFEGAELRLAEARLAAAEARWPEALVFLRSAEEICDESGLRWHKARIRIDWAEVYRRRNEPGDQNRARELLRESLAMFQEMGAPGYEKALHMRLAALEGDPLSH